MTDTNTAPQGAAANNNGPLDQDQNTTVTQSTQPAQNEPNQNVGPEKKSKNGKKMIEVEEDALKSILAKQEKMENEISILRQASDKTRLSRVEELRSQGKLIKKVKLNVYDGKVIIGWRKIKDDVYMDHEGRLHEDQIIGIIYEGEKDICKELDLRAFTRLVTKIDVEVLEESKDRDGNTNLLVQTSDGREIKIDINFIN